MQSLKSRLKYGMITGMTVLLIGFDLIIYHTISHTLFRQFDASLKSAANLMSASVEQDEKGNKFDFEFNAERMPEFVGGKKPAYYELWSSDGTAIKKSPSLDSEDLVLFKPVEHPYALKTFRMKNGRVVRAIATNFLPRAEEDSNAADISQPLILIVAYDTEELMKKLKFLKYLLCIASIGILGLAYIVAEVVVRRGLAPLGAVAEQIDNISEDNLKSRIAGENLPDEIVPIQRQLNSLLERLETSFERERTFNANVAHELRTPLAGLKSIVDVTLTRSRDAEEYRSALSESLTVVNNMEEMVSRLLMLARNESGQMSLKKEQIKLAQMIDKCWGDFAGKAAEAKIIFANRIDANFVCKSDAAGLSMIFSNLLNNAAEYTNRGGNIEASAQKTENGIEIIFKNTGNQLTSQQAQAVFDSFWQGDASRSNTGIHFGLGLALVKQMVELLSGKIRAEVSNDLFSIHIYLPLI
jgi:signal transduction histidine kinase